MTHRLAGISSLMCKTSCFVILLSDSFLYFLIPFSIFNPILSAFDKT